MTAPIRVLVLSRNYPNPAVPTMGLWAERLTQAAVGPADPAVIAPVPWAPPGLPVRDYSRYRAVPREERVEGLRVLHPRVPCGPGILLHAWDARVNYAFVERAADRLRATHPFALIHAHFIYPDGVMAARLGKKFGVPVVTTEHAEWEPWFAAWPKVRSQVEAAFRDLALVTGVSATTAAGIRRIAAGRVEVDVLPNVVDGEVFTPPRDPASRDLDRIVFVGAARRVKGLDVLVRALRLVVDERPKAHLTVVGEPFYRSWRKDEDEARRLASELRLDAAIRFTGRRTPAETARLVAESAVLAMPSRRETFGAAAAEALACGTPVVATRCGGPEEFLGASEGRLVPVDDPDALAAALLDVLARPRDFDRSAMRRGILARFDRPVVRDVIAGLYARVLAR